MKNQNISTHSDGSIRFVGFDAEFAIKEVLELSVYALAYLPDPGSPASAAAAPAAAAESATGSPEAAEGDMPGEGSENVCEEVFHQYFKPRKEQRWPGSERVHHISPEMVRHRPHFLKFRPMVQNLIDKADCLVGFAIDNDIEALKYEGVERLDDKAVIDIRDLHWLCRGKDAGVPLDSRRGLSVTAGELGIEFSESAAHGASYDTLKTMQCLQVLLEEFNEKYPARSEGPEDGGTASGAADAPAEELLERYLHVWEQEREKYYREYAKGWIAVVEATGGYRLKASRMNEPKGEKIVAVIHVNARYRALNELDARFDKRRHPLDCNVYKLTKADLEWFKGYANEYDGQEPLHRKMHELRSHGC